MTFLHPDGRDHLGRGSNRHERRVRQTTLAAFDLGVDDLLTMPFSPEELLAGSIVTTRRVSETDP
jgi:DNA-binding response OmpR family regulator